MEGRDADSRDIAVNKIKEKLPKWTYGQLVDIGAGAVAEASKKYVDKKSREGQPSPMTFTGYWKDGITQLYFMKHQNDEEGIITFGIKGGEHELISKRLSPYDRQQLALQVIKGLGYKIWKRKGRAGYDVYINKK